MPDPRQIPVKCDRIKGGKKFCEDHPLHWPRSSPVYNLLLAVLMAKSLTKKRTTLQAVNCLDSGLNDSVVHSNNRKKAKVLPSDSKFIYYITTIIYLFSLPDPSDQTRWSSRVNKGSGGGSNCYFICCFSLPQTYWPQVHSSETPVYTSPTSVGGNTLPRLTLQAPTPGSRYGFHLPSPAANTATSCANSTVPSVSHSTSTVLSVSWGGSVAFMSWGKAPTTPVTISTSSMPLRASQIVQQAQNHQLSPSMTSMLSRGHKIFPLLCCHHTVIMQTKTVSPSTMMIVTIPSLSAPLLMNLTLMRYLLMRMKGWLKQHCMPQVWTLHFSNSLLTILPEQDSPSHGANSRLTCVPTSEPGTYIFFIRFPTNTTSRTIWSISKTALLVSWADKWWQTANSIQ